jgi:hypothetical protein
MAAVDFVIAVLFFQRKIAGWWIAVADAIVRGLAIATTAGRANVFEAYSRMGWPSAQLQMMQSNPLYRSNWIIWGGLVGVVVTLGYLLWLRRFFTASNTP